MIARKKILVVEDNQLNRMMLQGILSPAYQVLEAENGQEALSVLKAQKDEISLILLDIVMPVMDGYTFLSHIKADEALSSIPVIVTTQNDGESDEVAALSHGATDFVAKPYKPQIILHRVANIINLRETAAMIHHVQYDRLTGVYSKAFFYQRVKEILYQNPDKSFDILCSDIENFKLINDVFGTPAGDRLLCGIADLLGRMVGESGICGRFNADRFACLIERRDAYTDEMFIQAGAEINALSGAKNIVVKWGVYSIVDRFLSVEKMCDRALLAAHSIKGQYGKYYAAYDDKLRSKLLREQAVTDGMETALAQNQFDVYYQPKYRIKDDCLVGAEALVRWNHPEWGLQSPGEFIPLFEKNGFITKLDQYVWDRACAQLKEWDEKGYDAVSVSVNVSRADIYNADIEEILMRTVQKYGLPPSRLHLEITESAYTENPSQIIDTVSRLRKLGFVIEMDDFGSGYSSLNMLNQMPLDILKLDMKFIQSETAKPINQGILRFIMGLARWMNLNVVAEGVETREQLARLREIGCDYVQGYYFAKPMPGRDFEFIMRERRLAAESRAPYPLEPRAQAVLVADEDPGYRAEVKKTFADRFEILEADNGDAALDYMAGYEHKLAAVILSTSLSGTDGFSVLEVLQRKKAVWSIPVIATGPREAAVEARAFSAGADDYAGKPHLQTSLLRRVQRAMGFSAAWERERMLRDEAYRDYQTGLLNRRGLYYAAESLQTKDAPLAVYLFDLDSLKALNAGYGHEAGDALIVQFGMLLQSSTRGTDILVRYDGDRFIVVVRNMRSAENALKKGMDICGAIQSISVQGQEIPVGVSGGITFWNAEDSLHTAIQRAEEALSCAKAEQKGGCRLWKGRSI